MREWRPVLEPCGREARPRMGRPDLRALLPGTVRWTNPAARHDPLHALQVFGVNPQIVVQISGDEVVSGRVQQRRGLENERVESCGSRALHRSRVPDGRAFDDNLETVETDASGFER